MKRRSLLFLAAGSAALAGHPETAVWTYNGSVPGPQLRYCQGGLERFEGAILGGLLCILGVVIMVFER